MKHGKRPTRVQKIKLGNLGLNHSDWLVVREDKKEFLLENRKSKISKKVNKENV